MLKRNLDGLSDSEVIANRAQFGANIIKTEKQNTFWSILKDITTEPIFILLVGTALLYFLLGSYSEGTVMLVSVVFISGIGLYQENRSKNAAEALKKLSPLLATVIRGGETIRILPEDIVLHDLIIAEEGTIVPADADVVEAHDFSVNESILTGESLAVEKSAENNTQNKILQGTSVISGSCIARVSAIGKSTSLGKIGQSLHQIEDTKTPLQIQIRRFVRSMVIVGVIAFIIVWGINYYLSKSMLDGLLHGLTIAMSVLPEEIPVAFSTFMALGAYRLYKSNVIVRNPHTVESLGAATVICTDKTGTITENKMELSAIYDFHDNSIYDFSKVPVSFNKVLEYAMWASETNPFDAMEQSIHKAYSLAAPQDMRPHYQMVHEYPLSGKPPLMTHVFSNDNGQQVIACKGSVEGVIRQCELSTEQIKSIHEVSSSFSLKGYRVLAVAASDQKADSLPSSQFDIKFQFIGMIIFYDPPKKNIAQVLQQFYKAGITVKMLTGDHAETAANIAGQIGLSNALAVLTGSEVMNMNEDELRRAVQDVNIYARMFPEAKLKVINALKANGEIVAMTGDGVNDGPALKAAHIGIAMGKKGSEIAKSAASLILIDDDFSHMPEAIALGRRIYENLKKAIQYIISIHIPVILIVLVPLIFQWRFTSFFSPVHVVFLELIMGPTCSVIFENEPMEANSMSKQPRRMSADFFSVRELLLSIIQGLLITAACLGAGYYFIITGHSETMARTIIYTTLIFSNLFLTLVNRSFYYSIFTTIRYKNKLLPAILVISLTVLFLSIYYPPARDIFHFGKLTLTDILTCSGVAAAGVGWVEFYKMWKRKIA